MLALGLMVLAVPLTSAPADSGVQFVRVLLSTQGASSISVPVKGTYTLAQAQRTFTDGTLTISASGSTVTISHSVEGQLYSGNSAIIERTNLSRDAGYLTIKTLAGTRNFLGNLQLSASNGILTVENEAQALTRARRDEKDKGGEAARAALAMLRLRERFGG